MNQITNRKFHNLKPKISRHASIFSIPSAMVSGVNMLAGFFSLTRLRNLRTKLSEPQSRFVSPNLECSFALAISDIVLINMWCHDFGREQADNKPLLKTVFQVMMRLFSPRKTTMLFVIRDKAQTTLDNLEPVLREDIQKIWDSVPKPEAHKETPLSDFFNLCYATA